MITSLRDADTAIHCFYNSRTGDWLEYTWDREIKMYAYSLNRSNGSTENGYIGLERMTERAEMEPGWEFIGVL